MNNYSTVLGHIEMVSLQGAVMNGKKDAVIAVHVERAECVMKEMS